MPANKNAATGGNLTRGGVFFCYSPHPQRSRENRRLATTAGTRAGGSALAEFRQADDTGGLNGSMQHFAWKER